jgi:predicted short-subunit dehydrogenase-like oxidoreductase (DUF2520 family)
MQGSLSVSDRPESPVLTDGFVPRRLLPTDGARWPFGEEDPIEDFEALVRERVSRTVNERGSKTRVLLGIVVETRDGMTRDAERARAIISECVEPNWRVRFLSGDERHKQGPLTELSALFGGTRPIMRAARASGLVPGHPKDWIWSAFMILLAVLLSVAAGLISHLAVSANVYSGGTVGLVVGAGMLATLAAGLKAGGIPVFGHPAMKRLEEAVTAEPAKTDADIGFARRLVEELTHERGSFRELSSQKRNRAVVIDDYGRLSPRTMELVEQYIRTRPDEIISDPTKERPEEFWAVFDKGSPPESERAQRSTGPISDFTTFGSFLAWTCRQQQLDDVRKRQLVRRLEHGTLDRNDRRLRYRRIGDIISGAKDATTEQELLSRLRDDGDSSSVLSFAFLAVAASVPSPALLRPADIAKTMSARGDGSPDPLRDLLLAWFPELGRPGPLSDALKNSARTFAPLFEEREKRDRGVRVDAGWADAFAHAYNAIRREYDLPPADCGHAFWALYWRRRLASSISWSAPAVESMITHLRALGEPASVSHRYGEHVARALCEAALFGAHAALALCVPGIAPGHSYSAGNAEEQEGLVDCALALISEGEEPQDDALRESLFDCAWALYMLTGHSALLESISVIDDMRPGRADDEPLMELYRESLVRGSDGLPPLPDHNSPGSAAVRDHARVRALWLAALLEPLIRRGRSHWLSEITAHSEATMVEVITRAVARTESGRDDLFDPLDYATLVVGGLWCTFKQTRGESDSDALTAAFGDMGRTIRRARENRRRSSVRTDFVLNGLLQMLIAIVGTKPDDLADLHVMWRSLELNELADLSGLCCNVYAAADPTLRLRDDAKLLVGLGGAEDRPINIVESELLAGITRLSGSVASGATLIVEAACVAIDAKLGEGFTFELSKLLVTQHLVIDYEKQERVLERALEAPMGHEGVLEVEDHELEARVTQLLNCVEDPRSAAAERLAATIASRRASIRSPWHEDALDQCLEYSQVGHTHAPSDDEELRALLTRWRTRMWEPGLPPSVAQGEESRETQTESALSLSNASSPGDAEVLYVYEFPKSGEQLRIPSAQLEAYHARTRYTYAFVLARIWDGADRVEGAVLDDAIRLLSEDLPPTLSGYVMLANRVSTRLAARGLNTSAAVERAIAIQREGIAYAQADLSPITNYMVYSELVEYDPASRADHERHAEFWQYEEHRLSQEQLFLQFEGRHYFEVFWYHYSRPPEPPCGLDRTAVETPYSSLPGEVPKPLLLNKSEEVVGMSGEFLRLGYEVFHRRPQRDGSEAIRTEISLLARRNVHPLYDLLMVRDTVSPSVRRLYQEQLKRFDELE